jgi:hypothetical protein
MCLSFNNHEFEASETEDQNFLTLQWHALENELLTLQKSLTEEEIHRNGGFLQLRSSPVAKANGEPKNATNVGSKSNRDPKKQAAKIEAPDSAPPAPETDRLASTEAMMKGLTGQAMLAPMLGMLKGMYDDQKKRIGDLNKREQKSKDRFAKQQSDFDAKINDIKLRHDKHKLSDEFFKNETRDYTRQFKYWQGVRERNHRQFHNALKITHGMMQREKDMISKYEAAMSMNMPEDKKTPAASKPVEAPEVVFVQQRKAAVAFIQEALIEVRQNLAETLSPSDHPASS